MAFEQRINLRVSQETYDAYENVAGMLGIPTSKLARAVVEGAVPSLQGLAVATRHSQLGNVDLAQASVDNLLRRQEDAIEQLRREVDVATEADKRSANA